MAMAEAVIPGRSLEQQRAALEQANMIRSWRAAQKREMTRARAVELILYPSELAETWRISDLLLSVPKVGKTKCATILRKTDTPAGKRLAGLSDRQRLALIGLLP